MAMAMAAVVVEYERAGGARDRRPEDVGLIAGARL
jgi:hypothetical protein